MRVAESVNRELAKVKQAVVHRSTLAVFKASGYSRTAYEDSLTEPELNFPGLSDAVTVSILEPVAQELTTGGGQSMLAMESSLQRHQITAKWSIIDWMTPGDPCLSSVVWKVCKSTVINGTARVFTTSCIFGGGRLERVQCEQCDLIFGPQKMLKLSAAALASEYDWHSRAITNRTRQSKSSELLRHSSRTGVVAISTTAAGEISMVCAPFELRGGTCGVSNRAGVK